MDHQDRNIPWHVKHRPKRFSEVAGQSDILFLQKMAADPDTIPPALLFAGPSGVGKTTAARILAKSVNCSEREGGEPCGSCTSCSSQSDMRITEIDAASFGTADDMRRLREQSLLSAGIGGRNVFIIDEAHSISWQGWNVLLKTLEEAESECLFILVTSEPSKVPLKIRTRTLKFDFTRVAPSSIERRLREVLILEDESFDDLDVIIDESRGSVREAIKLLEYSLINEDSYEKKDLSYDLLHAIAINDSQAALAVGSEWWDRSGDFRGILEMVGECLESIMLIDYNLPTHVSETTSSKLVTLADQLDEIQWAGLMETLSNWYFEPGNKASLSFMISQLIKAVHGSAMRKAAPAKKEEQEEKLDASEVGRLLEGI